MKHLSRKSLSSKLVTFLLVSEKLTLIRVQLCFDYKGCSLSRVKYIVEYNEKCGKIWYLGL